MNNTIINKIINKNGKNNYAYVVMVIKKDIYISPSIIFADSIRKIGCIGDLVIMIDKCINECGINVLKKFYNKIILIDSIEINNNSQIQSVILSKIHSFNLIEYKKIFLIDVDTILLTNIDKFFIDTNKPSANYINNEINYGFILIEPSIKLYNITKEFIKKNIKQIEKEEKPFNFVIKKIFKKMENLNINLSRDSFKDDIDGIQYTVNKPFLMSSNLSIENRMRLDYFKIWFSYLMNIINKYPEISNNNFLQEPIEISKYFLESMSRYIINFIKFKKNKKENQIINLYGMNKYKNFNYYHLDISNEYLNKNINYNLNILNFDMFFEYVKKIKNINFNKPKNIYNIKELIEYINDNEYINNKEDLINQLLNQYIKLYSNVFIVLEITNINKNISEIEDLKNNIIYKKQINMSDYVLKNILFNLYQNYIYTQRLDLLTKINDNKEYKINIIIYETVKQIETLDIKNNKNLFILFDLNSKIKISSIFFNKNTIIMFENKSILCNYIDNINYINRKSLIRLLYYQTLKKWIYNLYDGNQIENILILNYDKNKYKLIDNNIYNISKIKKINNEKIFFIDIIFLNISQYKNLLNNPNKIKNNIYDIEYYWELDGIKFAKENNITKIYKI